MLSGLIRSSSAGRPSCSQCPRDRHSETLTAGDHTTLKTIIRLPAILHLISLAILTACGGGSGGSDAVSAALPPVEVPPALPPQTGSGVQFTLDNSIAVSNDIAMAGGRLVLEVPGGATFTLDVPTGAFFAPSTTVSMQSIVDTQGLPPGLTPIAVVNLGPLGADFAVEPVIDIDLGNLSRPIGNIVLFLANDDGSGLTYLLPQGDDPIATALADGPYRARVAHFSGVGVAVSDPNGPGVPDIPDYATAEQTAVHALIRRFDDLAREVLMGQRRCWTVRKRGLSSSGHWPGRSTSGMNAVLPGIPTHPGALPSAHCSFAISKRPACSARARSRTWCRPISVSRRDSDRQIGRSGAGSDPVRRCVAAWSRASRTSGSSHSPSRAETRT